MWYSCKVDVDSLKRHIFSDIINDVETMRPSGLLSYNMRNRLEKFNRADRKDIINRTRDGVTPLFIACKRGLLEVVDYFKQTCDADLELKCSYEVPDDRSIHYVSPLWCAAVAGKEDVVRLLVGYGADINGVSDTGSTSVRSSCFMTHVEIVKFLVRNGADILRPNFNGGTCLINSVQSATLCQFLLDNGADINAQDIKCKTALHYAIEEHRFETVRLLMERGADPYIKSKLNDDALQTACIKGAFQIFSYLMGILNLNSNQRANAYELLGSTFLDEHHDIHETIQMWKTASIIREKSKVPKDILPPMKAFGFVKEYNSVGELQNVLLDHDAIRVHSLLICRRILGPAHKDTIFRLMFRGAAYADTLQYKKCIQLWLYALELRIRKDTILFNGAFFTYQALVKLYIDIFDKYSISEAREIIEFEDAYHALKLIADEIGECQKLLSIKPEYRRQQHSFDQSLNVIIHMIYILIEVTTAQDEDQLRELVTRIVVLKPCTNDGKSLLFLSVYRNDLLTAATFPIESRPPPLFPCYKVARLLLECGAPVNATNRRGISPLYIASFKSNYSKKLILLLLSHGAHLDQIVPRAPLSEQSSIAGYPPSTALGLLNLHHGVRQEAQWLPCLSLKCLAAQAVQKSALTYDKADIPPQLYGFLQIH